MPFWLMIRRAWRFCHAYLCLLLIHRLLRRGGFEAVRSALLIPWRTGNRELEPDGTAVREIAWAVETACNWQWQRTVCLHRSAAAYCLLRQARGRPIHITGVMTRPFASHAWVEIGGHPVADQEMDAVRYHYHPMLRLPVAVAELHTPNLPSATKAATVREA